MINEFKRMQQLAGLLTEVNVAPAYPPLLSTNTGIEGIDIIFNAPNGEQIQGWHEESNPTQITFGASIYTEDSGLKKEEAMKELETYLRKSGVKYNSHTEENEFVDGDYEYYISTSLEGLKRKLLFKK